MSAALLTSLEEQRATSAELRATVADLRALVATLTEENRRLREQAGERRADVVDLKARRKP